ncbi:hypothetical protein [Candidatus Nitrospira bockiana]
MPSMSRGQALVPDLLRLGMVMAGVLGLALLPALSAGQEPSGALKLVLTTDKPQVLLGEPVYVTVQLLNTGASPVEVFQNLDPEVGALQVDVTGPQGAFGYVPYAIADSEIRLEPLAPRAEVSAVVPIFYGGRGWTFTQPGDYTIQAVYTNPVRRSMPVRSNPLSITVQRHAAGEFLMKGEAGEEAGKFLLWQQGDHLRKGLRRLTDLIEQYPDSPLGDYARLALGLNLSRSFKDYSIGQVRKPDYEVANRYLQKVEPARLPASLQIETHLAHARSLLQLGRGEEARRLVDDARRIAGDRTPLLSRLKEVLRRHPELR